MILKKFNNCKMYKQSQDSTLTSKIFTPHLLLSWEKKCCILIPSYTIKSGLVSWHVLNPQFLLLLSLRTSIFAGPCHFFRLFSWFLHPWPIIKLKCRNNTDEPSFWLILFFIPLFWSSFEDARGIRFKRGKLSVLKFSCRIKDHN